VVFFWTLFYVNFLCFIFIFIYLFIFILLFYYVLFYVMCVHFKNVLIRGDVRFLGNQILGPESCPRVLRGPGAESGAAAAGLGRPDRPNGGPTPF